MRQSPLIEKASLHCYEKLIGTQTLEKRISLEKYSQAHPCERGGSNRSCKRGAKIEVREIR